MTDQEQQWIHPQDLPDKWDTISREDYLNVIPCDPHDPVIYSALVQLIAECHRTATEKGWWDAYGETLTPDEVSSKLCLVHSEISEGLDEVRKNSPPLYFSKSDDTEELKPEGLSTEMADAVIRLFDLAAKQGIDLAYAIAVKMEYNKKRSYKHGGKAI